MLPLALAGLAGGALRLARDPTVQRIVKKAIQGGLQGLTSGKGLFPGALSGAQAGLLGSTTTRPKIATLAKAYPKRRRRRVYAY